MAIAKGTKIGGGRDASAKIYFAPPSASYPVQILDIEDVMEAPFGEPDTPENRTVPKFRVTFVVIDKLLKQKGENGEVKMVPQYRDTVPAYEFQQDPDDYNPYGKRFFWSITRAFSAPREKDGKTTSPSNLYKLYSIALNEGKPLTAEQIREVQTNPALLNNLIGAKLMVGGENGPKPKGGTRFRVKSISVLSGVKNYPDYTPPTLVLSDEQLNDKSPAMVYADTGEPVYGYHILQADGKWKFINRADAAGACIEKWGEVYSPAKQKQLKEAGAPAASAAPSLAVVSEEDEEVIPF
jgi:hypothetical protein